MEGALESKPLLLVGATVFVFQTANGAMLPFTAQALTSQAVTPA